MCWGFFSSCYNQIPWQSLLKEKVLFLAHSSRWSPSWWEYKGGKNLKHLVHIKFTLTRRQQWMNEHVMQISRSLFPFIQSRERSHPPFRQVFPHQLATYRSVRRTISQVILDFVKVTLIQTTVIYLFIMIHKMLWEGFKPNDYSAYL